MLQTVILDNVVYFRVVSSINGGEGGRHFDRAVLAVCYAKNRIGMFCSLLMVNVIYSHNFCGIRKSL